MTESQPEVNETNYPSLNLIYPLAIESHETSRQRMITQDARIQQMITLTLAITAAVPAVYQIFDVNPNITLLAVAGIFFLIGIFMLIYALMHNKLNSIDIATLHKHYIRLPECIAKEALIKYAGESDKEDAAYMFKRQRLLLFASIALSLEVITFLLSGFGLWC